MKPEIPSPESDENPIPIEPVTPEAPIVPEPAPTPSFLHKLIPVFFTLIFLIISMTIAFVVGTYSWPHSSWSVSIPSPTPRAAAPVTTSRPYPSPVPTPVRPQTTVELGNITWLPVPVKIANLQLLKDEEEFNYEGMGSITTSEARYYHVANLSTGGRLLNIITPVSGPLIDNVLIRIIETADKRYVAQKWGDIWNWQDSDLILIPSVTYTTQNTPGLETPETIPFNNLTFTRAGSGYDGTLYTELSDPKKLGDTYAGPLYQVRTKIFTVKDLYARQIYLRLNDGTVAKYDLKTDLFADDGKANVTWSDGRSPVSYETIRTGGCGFGTPGVPIIVDNSSLLAGIQAVGTTNLGDKVYQIVDPNNELIKFLYKEGYSVSRSDPLTLTQFAAKPNHFIWKDPLADWQIAISQDYALLAECAKPVIYLYPQKPQIITVKVGANIRQADPPYTASGWKVMADPSGKISYRGQEYPYLFWDGTGRGIYPDHHDRGVVVARSEIEDTLHQQLAQLGLNTKEAAEFMDFWLPLMPDFPYVRLTWLGTRDMNRLAPLTVSPTPDTVIRVFLEFEGLNQYVQLTPQIFNSPVRRGFTLVEWGGLLNSK